MKTKNIIAAFGALIFLAACSDNDSDGSPLTDTRVPITPAAGISTRAADQIWHAGDAIGIFAGDDQANFKYINTATAHGATATFYPVDQANTAYYPADGSQVTIRAYYPYASAVTSIVPVDVSSQANLPAIDLMTAAAVTGDKENPAASLTFTHRLTKLSITLIQGEGAGDIDLTTARVALTGTRPAAAYDLHTEAIAPHGSPSDIDLVLPTAIVVPTAAGSGVSFTVDAGGHIFIAPLPASIALVSGEEVTVNITLKVQTEVSVEITADIKPWTDGPTTPINTRAMVIGDSDLSKLPAGELTITSGTVSGIYGWDGSNTITTIRTLYWESLAGNTTHDFALEFVPTAPGIPDKDELTASATGIAPGTTIIFGDLSHINSRLIVNLLKGTGYTDAEWDAAVKTLTLSGFSSVPYAMADGKAIVKPAAITAAHKVTLVIGTHTYEIALNNVSGFPATFISNNEYTLTATVNKSEVSVGTGDVKPWEAGGSGTSDFEY